MHKSARAFLGLSLVIAAGPGFAQSPLFAQSPSSAAQAEPLTGVLERIRQDVGYYEVHAARWRADIDGPTMVSSSAVSSSAREPQSDSTALVCPTKDFDFDVTNVQMTLQTVMADTGNGSVGLQIPLLGKEGAATVKSSLQVGRTQTIALTRRFSYNRDQLSQYQQTADYQRLETAHQTYRALETLTLANPVLPIADALIDLHTNLIRSAEKLPCFEWTDKDVKPESSSITLEFLVQKAADADVGFNFWIVSAEAGAKIDHTNVNTLVVSFAPHVVTTSAAAKVKEARAAVHH
jgi:hypothetical protein